MVLYLGGLIMAYFLRQEKKKKGTYLQMYDSYWDKEKKESRTKSVMAFGYVEELISDELPDPVAIIKTLLQRKMKSGLHFLPKNHGPVLFLPPLKKMSDISSSTLL